MRITKRAPPSTATSGTKSFPGHEALIFVTAGESKGGQAQVGKGLPSVITIPSVASEGGEGDCESRSKGREGRKLPKKKDEKSPSSRRRETSASSPTGEKGSAPDDTSVDLGQGKRAKKQKKGGGGRSKGPS